MRIRLHFVALIAAVMILMPSTTFAFTTEIELRRSDSIERGREFLKKGHIQAAIKQYEMGLRAGLGSTDLKDAHNDLCVAYYFLAKYKKALKHCDEAIRLVPNHWIHYNNRANIYLMQGELTQAKRDYQKALKLHPNSDVIEKNIALADKIEKTRPSASRPMSDGKKDQPDTKDFDSKPAAKNLTGSQ